MLAARLLAIATAVLALAEAQILPSQYNGPNGLNDAAAALGKYMGTASDAYNYPSVASNGPYMTELKNKKDWGMITAANSMKPSSLQPNKGKFNYGPADQLVAMAKSMGAKMRCHTMLWHTQVPGWMNTGNNATMLQGLDDHIRAVMTHFGDICYAWDVVNEIVADNGGYRTSFWYNTAGASYIAHAFQTADKVRKELGLNVKLYYNDYGIEWDGSAKTKFALNMVKGLKDQGVPIDGVGLQSHFQTGGSPSKSALINIMNKYIALGVEVAVTELDEKLQSGPSASQQQQQSRDYAAVSGACAAVSKCVGVTIWDFNDEDSWIHGAPLPFHQAGGKGTTLERKLAYDGIMEGWTSSGGVTVAPTNAPTTKTPTSAPTTQTPTSGPTNAPTTSAPTTAPTNAPTTSTPTTAPTNAPTQPADAAQRWGRCGGNGWTGPTTCVAGSSCVKYNEWFSMCT